MRRDPFLSYKIGSVPVMLLKAMLDAATRRKQVQLGPLFADVRERLGRHSSKVSEKLLVHALMYLVQDRIVEVRGESVYRIRKGPNPEGWTAGIAVLEPQVRRALAGAVVGRKAVGGRKKSAGPKFVPSEFSRLPEDVTARAQRRFRDADSQRFEVPIFFATDRERSTRQPIYSNSGLHAKELHRGAAIVSFPAKHRRGKLDVAPRIITSLFPERYVRIEKLNRLAKSTFHRKLAAELAKYDDSMFIFVHGFNTSFDIALKRTAQIALDTGFNGAAIAFSWPSRARSGERAYLADRGRINTSAARLAAFIRELRTEYPNSPIHLIAHSVGAEIAAQAMSKLGAGERVNEVILQAPDIAATDWDGLADALSDRAVRVSVYTSTKDRALAVSSFAHLGSSRVGRDVRRAMRRDIDAIDASTQGDGTFWGHGYGFAERLSSDVGEVMRAVPQTRTQLERRDVKDGTYYVFRR